MSKKSFTTQSKEVINKTDEQTNVPSRSSKPQRTTLYIRPDLYEKLKDIAYWERETLTSLTEAAFAGWVAQYERDHGAVEPRPEGK